MERLKRAGDITTPSGSAVRLVSVPVDFALPSSPKDFIGIPFVDGGRDPKTGLDCWGAVMGLGKCFGKDIPDFAIAPKDHRSVFDTFLKETASPRWEELSSPEPGCIVAMALKQRLPNDVQHYGICIDKHHFIHATRKMGSIKARLDDPMWKNRIKGFYRWIG